jgi:hypothetical protein
VTARIEPDTNGTWSGYGVIPLAPRTGEQDGAMMFVSSQDPVYSFAVAAGNSTGLLATNWQTFLLHVQWTNDSARVTYYAGPGDGSGMVVAYGGVLAQPLATASYDPVVASLYLTANLSRGTLQVERVGLGTTAYSALTPQSAEVQYTHLILNGQVTVTGYTGPDRNLAIPDTLGGYPVIHIGNYAFWDCSNLTSVTIPDSVTTLRVLRVCGLFGPHQCEPRQQHHQHRKRVVRVVWSDDHHDP